jgi:hypothetical protein
MSFVSIGAMRPRRAAYLFRARAGARARFLTLKFQIFLGSLSQGRSFSAVAATKRAKVRFSRSTGSSVPRDKSAKRTEAPSPDLVVPDLVPSYGM